MRRLSILLFALVLLAAACGGDDEPVSTPAPTTAAPAPTTAAPAPTTAAPAPTTAAPAPTTAAPASTTAAPAPTTAAPAPGPESRPPAAVTASLEFSYHTAGTFDPAAMGFDVGEVTAEWYSADGFFVVVFAGLDLGVTGPLCPGASVALGGTDFQFVANAPTEGADCSSFATLSNDPDVRAYECDGVLSFRTAIPVDAAGTLYGTVERPADGGIMGITSTVPNTPGEFAMLDLDTLGC